MRSLLALLLLIPLNAQSDETVIYSTEFPKIDCPPPRQTVIYESTRYGDDWGRGFAISPRQVYDIRVVPYGSVRPGHPVQPPKSYGTPPGRVFSGLRREPGSH